ncbi:MULTISPECIES: IS5 family transposase [Micromonospora]|uniref:IS5 family transposase n=1 Tax=Micromonospora TaxID=1873 RepID=UPI001EF09858|nr:MULTISPECIES: IS5 family transposase [unclassified Micromonospora]
MSGRFELTDVEYARIAPLLPAMTPQRGGRWRDHRQVINGIVFRVRTGVPWRDVPARYGPWKTLYKRFARWQEDGTWARIEAMLQADADAAGDLDWHGNADSTIVRAHQHAAGARKGGWTVVTQRDGKDSASRAAGGPRRSTRSVTDEAGT